MARGLFAAVALAALALAPAALGCSLPPGGCLLSKCNALNGLAPPGLSSQGFVDKRIGWYYGLFNKNINGGNSRGVSSEKGGPSVNYEVFPQVEIQFLLNVDTSAATTLAKCCTLCAVTPNCSVYQFFASGDWTKVTTVTGAAPRFKPKNFIDGKQCYLLSGGTVKSDAGSNEGPYGSPFSGTHTQQISSNTSSFPNIFYPPSWVGGDCNPNASVVDDPHFVGAHGTHFDFNGRIGSTFCLITDERLHVNIKLGGYEDSRTYGATVLKNGKALRTWIKELGVVWRVGDGSKHTARLSARAGKDTSRGKGFLAKLVVDGKELSAPAPGKSLQRGAFALRSTGWEKKGPYDVDTYVMSIDTRLQISIKMRPAHPLLQTKDDAQIHFNLHMNHIEATPRVHGVLGQTFRNTVQQQVKAMEYRMMSTLVGGPVVADGKSGMGFLDGKPGDYISSEAVATDCKYSAFV